MGFEVTIDGVGALITIDGPHGVFYAAEAGVGPRDARDRVYYGDAVCQFIAYYETSATGPSHVRLSVWSVQPTRDWALQSARIPRDHLPVVEDNIRHLFATRDMAILSRPASERVDVDFRWAPTRV